MRNRILSVIIAGAMAVSTALVGVSAAQAADTSAWGYTSTPKNTNGSLDFSGWTNLGTLSSGTQIGQLSFTRNSLSYTITVNTPVSGYDDSAHLLVANVVVNENDGSSWTYAFGWGDASTSLPMYTTDNMTSYYEDLAASSITYYVKHTDAALAVAVTGTAYVDDADSPQIAYSEVLDVTSDGRMIHTMTFTNTSAATLPSIGFMASLDTMLGDNDEVPIIANGTNSVYIDNGAFRLYLEMLKGDVMEAGPWWNASSRDGFVPVNNYAKDQTIITDEDSDVSYTLNKADLRAGTSVSLSFQERLLAPVEVVPQNVTVTYVDDDANGAAITPTAGTVTAFTGMPGDPVGFTTAAAQAGVPAGYEVASIENVATYDVDPAVDQVIVVHVRHTLPTGAEAAVEKEPVVATTTGGLAHLADSTDAYTLVTTLTGINDVALPGYAGHLTTSVPANVTATGFSDNHDGTYNVGVRASVPGNYLVTVYLDGVQVGAPIPVNFIGATIDEPVRAVGDPQTADGLGFLPGEEVDVVVHSDPINIGRLQADRLGQVPAPFQVPKDFDLGRHTVTFTGATSGAVTVTFTVTTVKLPTGGTVRTNHSDASLLVLAATLVVAGVLVQRLRSRTAKRG